MHRGAAIAAGVAIAMPAAAHAQAYSCAVPATIPVPHAELPSTSEPARRLPIGGYTLAVTWAPHYCHLHARDAAATFECASGNRFGFTLHGLWPDGRGKTWPQYCKATHILPRATIAAHLCAVPSAQLVQHEWAKHGTCTTDTPDRFLARSRALYAKLRYPDMDALSRRKTLTAGQLAAAVARRNPGMSADMMRITADRHGWLDEIWFCLDTHYRYKRCASYQGGLPARARIRIWRGVR